MTAHPPGHLYRELQAARRRLESLPPDDARRPGAALAYVRVLARYQEALRPSPPRDYCSCQCEAAAIAQRREQAP